MPIPSNTNELKIASQNLEYEEVDCEGASLTGILSVFFFSFKFLTEFSMMDLRLVSGMCYSYISPSGS